MTNLIPDGKHLLSGVCEVTAHCGYDGEDTTDGILLTIDGQNYLAYTDPDDGYRSYSCFSKAPAGYEQKNSFPGQQVMVSNEEWDDMDETGYPQRGHKIAIYNIDTTEEIFSCGTINDDDYYPIGFWHYHPENLPVNAKKDDIDKQFEDALSTLRKCLGMSDEHEEGYRTPTEKPAETVESVAEPGDDYDIDRIPDNLFQFDADLVSATDWEIMEHVVRESVKRRFQDFLDNKFDKYETNRLLALWEDFSQNL